MANDDTILEFRSISKAFPGVQALSDVTLSVRSGEVHAIVGENGAGKSTLMKILAGLYQPDGGEILLYGAPVTIGDAHEALKLGIAMVPQELNLVPEMTIAENVLLGIEPRAAFGVVKRRQQRSTAEAMLASLGLSDVDVDGKLMTLAIAEQQMVQIGRALAFQCKILIMDEPTAALSEREKNALFDQLRLMHQRGATLLYISHRMEEIFEIADRITVLRDGRLVGTLDRTAATEDKVVQMMIGRSLAEYMQERTSIARQTQPVLEVRNLTRRGLFHDISFQVRQGEILGFAGLVGARRTELLSSVFGSPPPDSGEILIDGEVVEISSPHEAIRRGVGYVPEERKRQGIFPVLSVLSNITIPFIDHLQRLTVVDRKQERATGGELASQLHIQTPSLDQAIVKLSGGNQQKVILSRWLGSGARILILDEPTRGIDVNAKAEIHGLIGDLATEGKSIILISSELQELMSICDRILVMREGSLEGEVDPKTVTEEEVLRLAMFGTEQEPAPAPTQELSSSPSELSRS